MIDARGRVRYTHFGEGDYEETEAAIRALLAEAGEVELGARAQATTDSAREGTTPESYLGAQRAERFVHGALRAGTRRYVLARAKVAAIPAHHLGFEGRWRVEDSRSVAAGDDARLHLRFTAARVFLVLGSNDRTRRVGVRLDGRSRRPVRVSSHRLYEVARLDEPGEHLLTLEPERGVEAYAFTFG